MKDKTEYAFPSVEGLVKPANGLTMRDYFAGRAITGLAVDVYGAYSAKDLAVIAYEIAEAMMEARKVRD